MGLSLFIYRRLQLQQEQFGHLARSLKSRLLYPNVLHLQQIASRSLFFNKQKLLRQSENVNI